MVGLIYKMQRELFFLLIYKKIIGLLEFLLYKMLRELFYLIIGLLEFLLYKMLRELFIY